MRLPRALCSSSTAQAWAGSYRYRCRLGRCVESLYIQCPTFKTHSSKLITRNRLTVVVDGGMVPFVSLVCQWRRCLGGVDGTQRLKRSLIRLTQSRDFYNFWTLCVSRCCCCKEFQPKIDLCFNSAGVFHLPGNKSDCNYRIGIPKWTSIV